MGVKPHKDDAMHDAQRKGILEKYVGKPKGPGAKSGFADPAAMFGK